MHTHAKVSFSIRIPLGTEPSHVFVGWTTPVFKDGTPGRPPVLMKHTLMTLWRYCSRGWAKMSGRWPRKYQHHFSYSWANYCPKIILSKKATCEYSLCCVCKLCAILCTFFCSVSCILDTNSMRWRSHYTECECLGHTDSRHILQAVPHSHPQPSRSTRRLHTLQ